ncbi:beta-1,3-galactosyltransferase 5 [Scaptodrosophila lebanonensis]|uniref:Hexosyltransferase n=1 Tax=Drosophila lebanonensis TaxID=7225 RepID=A0A6J2T7S3_DROLE|nr:beta-1,3-galactosyltransferase 5 [Scaptodrosophila lebanonensis]
MLDRRPFWGLIIWLNLCVVIWLVTVQEPVMPEGDAATSGSATALSTLPQTLGSQQWQQISQSSRANGSAYQQACQKHDSSRTQISNHSYDSTSIVRIVEGGSATPAPSPTAASVLQSTAGTDDGQLIDLRGFFYLMAQPPCEWHTQALILVHTAPGNVEKRTLIRQTWGSESLLARTPVRLVFLLGAVPEAEGALQLALIAENEQHKDMVQGNFQDAYRNMTYKHVMALKWFHNNCKHAQLLIKVDDDVYVNTPRLIRNLQPFTDVPMQPATVESPINLTTTPPPMRLFLQQPRDLLLCLKFVGARVKRSYRSKWRVSFSEYAERYYPPYCPGFAIVYSADVVERLYRAAQQSRYFWVDDVMITGVLAQRTNTTIISLKPYILYEPTLLGVLAGQIDLGQLEFLVSWHSISPQQVDALWQMYATQNYTLNSGPSLEVTEGETNDIS